MCLLKHDTCAIYVINYSPFTDVTLLLQVHDTHNSCSSKLDPSHINLLQDYDTPFIYSKNEFVSKHGMLNVQL